MSDYKTPQEEFWAGEFGVNYIGRNESAEYLASNLSFFSKAMRQIGKPASLIEFGANIGMNVNAIKQLYPGIQLNGVEINETAAAQLGELIGKDNVYNGSIFDYPATEKFEVALIKGVLIHINAYFFSIKNQVISS